MNNFEIFEGLKGASQSWNIRWNNFTAIKEHNFKLSTDTVLNALKIADPLSNLNEGFRKYTENPTNIYIVIDRNNDLTIVTIGVTIGNLWKRNYVSTNLLQVLEHVIIKSNL